MDTVSVSNVVDGNWFCESPKGCGAVGGALDAQEGVKEPKDGLACGVGTAGSAGFEGVQDYARAFASKRRGRRGSARHSTSCVLCLCISVASDPPYGRLLTSHGQFSHFSYHPHIRILPPLQSLRGSCFLFSSTFPNFPHLSSHLIHRCVTEYSKRLSGHVRSRFYMTQAIHGFVEVWAW